MKIPAKKLEEHLSKKLANLYIICGDEPILFKEAQEQIRSKAISLGFSERKINNVLVKGGLCRDWNRE